MYISVIPDMLEAVGRRIVVQVAQVKNVRPHLKNNFKKGLTAWLK
jgi:hypothetical protein